MVQFHSGVRSKEVVYMIGWFFLIWVFAVVISIGIDVTRHYENNNPDDKGDWPDVSGSAY